MRWAIKGHRVCPTHGGSTARTKAKAAEVYRRERAEAALARTGRWGALLEQVRPDVEDVDPHELLLEVVAHTTAMRRAYELMVNELAPGGGAAYVADDTVEFPGGMTGIRYVASSNAGIYGTDHKGDTRPHVLVELLGVWTDRAQAALKAALSAGIDVRRIELAEGQAQILAAALKLFIASVFEYAGELGVDRQALAALEAEAPRLLRAAISTVVPRDD